MFLPYANNKDADQPAQSDQRLCDCCQDSIIPSSFRNAVATMPLQFSLTSAVLRASPNFIP